MKKVFELNPYDRCVANKMVNGKHCTFVWHLDNNKVLHVEAKVLGYLIDDLKRKFGELFMTGGEKHEMFGININITEYKKIDIYTKNQMFEVIEEFVEDIDEILTTPASSQVFIINKEEK